MSLTLFTTATQGTQTMADLPPKLEEMLAMLDLVTDRAERIQLLIDLADRFEEVPPRIARRPFGSDHLVPACESEAYVWGEARPDGNLDFHFAVENPQGISAKSLAVILDEGLSGASLAEAAAVPQDLVYRVFGRELSMGKSMGLMGMVSMVSALAKQRLAARAS